MRRNLRSTTTARRRAWKLSAFWGVVYGDIVGNLPLRDQLRLGRTCHHLRKEGLSLFVSQQGTTIDLSRRLKDDERKRVCDAFFQSILFHARSLLSVEGQSRGVETINLTGCQDLTDASIIFIAAVCPFLKVLAIT